MRKKVLSVILSMIMTASMLAGCGSASSETESGSMENAGDIEIEDEATATSASVSLDELPAKIGEGIVKATPEMYGDVDLSEHKTVNITLIGDTPAAWDDVLAKTNEYLEPFNTEVEVSFLSWSDYQQMYPLTLTGGQVDLIFTAPWCFMYTEAAKGSFYVLDTDFISKNMPLTSRFQAAESWDETTISGQTIAVPSNQASPMGKIVAIRQDLADKYGISSLDNWDDYMNYAKTIAEKETPESGIYALAASGDNNELWDVYRQQEDTFLALDSDYFDLIYNYKEGSLPEASDIKLVYETDLFKSYANDMKELADAGAWSRSALTNTVTDDDAFGNLQGASIAWNTSVFTYIEQAEQTEGVVGAAYDLTKNNLVGCECYSNNDMAIAAGSADPARAAMVLDILKCDTYLNHLWILGVEDEHYTINDAGEYTETDKAGDFAAYAISASWAIKNGDLKEAGGDPRAEKVTESWEERVVNNPTVTFVFDDSNVADYKAAVSAVLNDYVPMLELGLVDDVDSTIDEMIKACYDSGLQNVLDEFSTQYDAWKATR
ncbi:ABC transporter substrate-binding protein [Butyrivibrio sp. AE3006]|uniref:ABC transporter substrate-binding protein n=1 Tax=Butyrivibrio sp. AE3006 TaxID=1280673 RepID=UPI0004092D3E|nr:ABC transporter substrate-binding protein [Butyrivibrio sp. AE3006]